MPPNLPISSLSPNNKNLNINNKIINGTLQEKNSINNNTIIQDSNNMNYVLKNLKKVTCTCTRTQCQKKYCACFALGKYCQGCDCKGCLNTQKASNTQVLLVFIGNGLTIFHVLWHAQPSSFFSILFHL